MRYPKLFYFFSFAALASLLPFLTLYYQQFGLNGRQIGVLVAIPPLVALVSAPLFGAIADATGRHKLMLVLAVCGFAAGVLILSAVGQYVWLVAAVFVYAIFFAPVLPLVD
ncbi:MAG: MFS transporter, partial [Chloroflexi bacterium]